LSKGLASVKTLTAKQIADKWKLPLAVVAKKIAAGVKVEKEHTTSTRQANEIARDHLGERPDYYDKLDKMEKTKVVKENSTVTAGIGGLGFNTGTPAIVADNEYINTNALSYYDENGNKLDYINRAHNDHHNAHLGFRAFDPTRIGANKNFHGQHKHKHEIKEAKHPLQANFDKYVKGKLNELGEYDNKGGSSGYEGISGPIRAVRKNEMTPIKERSTGKIPADMSDATARGIYEISAELVGKVSNARWRRGEAPSKTLTRAINKKFIESGKKKEEPKKDVKEFWMPFIQQHHKHTARLSKKLGNKPDLIVDRGGEKGQTKHGQLFKEETKMDNKELINEALDCILEDNLPEMKDNLMLALQEKAMEKLEERKKEIAANYFAQ